MNYNGYLCDEFMPDLPTFGARFTVCLPLTPGALMNSRVDPEKVRAFVDSHEPGVDYRLVDCEDLKGIGDMYEEDVFKIVAFIKGEDGASTGHRLFALPKKILGIP